MKSEPALGYGVSGWKARQERARYKNSRGKTQAEKEAIRAARAALYARQTSQGAPEPVEVVNDPPEYEEVEMTREEMIAELEAAGQRVHHKMKDETLAKKVEELRNA